MKSVGEKRPSSRSNDGSGRRLANPTRVRAGTDVAHSSCVARRLSDLSDCLNFVLSVSQAISSGSCSSSSSSSSSSGSGRCRTGNNSFDNRRVLKAQSVDAINRKNVLFSARCRSGCDLRTGSPLMQRDEDENGEEDEEDEEEELPVRRRDPREEIKELERMVSEISLRISLL